MNTRLSIYIYIGVLISTQMFYHLIVYSKDIFVKMKDKILINAIELFLLVVIVVT